MHIYAFGSICRGEIDFYSDIDVIAIVHGKDERLDASKFSIYSYKRIKEIWHEGNPFAWHLFLESKMIYTSDGTNFFKELNSPNSYEKGKIDCKKFFDLFLSAKKAVGKKSESLIFEFSNIFLAIRNFATCYKLAQNEFYFSRDSALKINESVPISKEVYTILERTRILTTRGEGRNITYDEAEVVKNNLKLVENWMKNLMLDL